MSIFDDSEESVVTIDESKDYVTELVGDGKKFKDVAALARGKAEADLYIKQLTERLDEARKELGSRTSLEDFLKEMKSLREPAPPQNVQEPIKPDGGTVDDSTLEEKILRILEQKSQKEVGESNLDRVKRVLNDQLGSEARAVINKKSTELGMSVQELESLAAKSPSAFFTLVGVAEQRQPSMTPVAPRGSVNSLGNPQVAGVKNKAYFDKLKQTNPSAYWDKNTTAEMIKARKDCEKAGIPWE